MNQFFVGENYDPRAIQLWQEMLRVDGSTMVLKTERTQESLDRSPDGVTFLSAEATEFMIQQFATWLGTRFQRRDQTVHDVEIEIKIKIDGEEQDTPFTMPYRPQPVIDGTHRTGRIA